jgi:hypothetical protein
MRGPSGSNSTQKRGAPAVNIKGVICFLCVLVASLSGTSVPVFADVPDLSHQKKIIAGLRDDMDYLRSRHMDIADLELRHGEIIKDISAYEECLAVGCDAKNAAVLFRLINLNIETLGAEVHRNVDNIKRLDLLYLVMLVFGSAIGIGFAVYIVVMYNKRK